jgi:hypothetical protein
LFEVEKNLSIFETIISATIIGIGTGIGVAIGQFFASRMVITHLERIERKLKMKTR